MSQSVANVYNVSQAMICTYLFHPGTGRQLTFADLCEADSFKLVSKLHVGMRCHLRVSGHMYLRFCEQARDTIHVVLDT